MILLILDDAKRDFLGQSLQGFAGRSNRFFFFQSANAANLIQNALAEITEEKTRDRNRCTKFNRRSVRPRLLDARVDGTTYIYVRGRFKNLLAILFSNPFTIPTFTFVQHVEPIWSRHHAPNMRGVAKQKESERARD